MIFVVNFYKEKKNREIAFQHVQLRKSVQEIIRKRLCLNGPSFFFWQLLLYKPVL